MADQANKLETPSALAEALDRSFAALWRELDALTATRRETGGPDSGWSPKVHLAHVAFWDDYQTGRMEAARAGHSQHGYPRPDHDNDDRAQMDQALAWSDVAARAHAARARLIEFALGLSEAELKQEFLEGERVFSIGAQLNHMVRHTEMHRSAIHDAAQND